MATTRKFPAKPARPRVPAPRKPKAPRRMRGTGAAFVYDSLKSLILDLELQPGTPARRDPGQPAVRGVALAGARGADPACRPRAWSRICATGPRWWRRSIVAALPAYFDAVQLLYRLSARLAAVNVVPAKLEKLNRIVREHEDALHRRDMQSMILSNRDFHTAVAEMSGNPFIAGWMRGLLDQGQRLLRLYARNLGDSLPDAALKPHRDMVEAIAAGDADRAEEAGRADALVMVEEFKRELSNRPAALLLLHGGR